jgi:hypothetical protein
LRKRNRHGHPTITLRSPSESGKIGIPQSESVSINQQRFSFTFECCNDSRCFKKISELRDKADLVARLHELSQLTWVDAIQSSKKSLGSEKLEDIKVNHNLVPKGAHIIGFIYHDFHRMIGYRDEKAIFHILWFDYDGKLYKHSK